MTEKQRRLQATRPSALIMVSLLATLGCNAILGIEEATCVGTCDGTSATSDAGTAEEALPGAGASALNDAGVNTGVPAFPEGAASGAGDIPLDNGQAPSAATLDDIIAAACAEQAAGKPFCVVNHRVVCGADGSPDSVNVCADADHCSRGAGPDCATCSLQTFVCQAKELWGCDPAAGEMALLESCASAPLCNAALGRCEAPDCTPGQRRCQGAQLQVCNAGGTGFTVQDECASAELCDSTTGACTLPACAPSERRCQGSVLQECNASRTGFDVVEQCASAALCDAPGGVCGTAACAPDQMRCQGAALQRCNAGGTGFTLVEQCASAALCNAVGGACVAPVCAPNQGRCDGDRFEVCNALGTAFLLQDECSRGEECSPDAGCTEDGGGRGGGNCTTGERRCEDR